MVPDAARIPSHCLEAPESSRTFQKEKNATGRKGMGGGRNLGKETHSARSTLPTLVLEAAICCGVLWVPGGGSGETPEIFN